MATRTPPAVTFLALLLTAAGCSRPDQPPPQTSASLTAGSPPWHAAATGNARPLATWTDREDRDAPGGGPVIALTAANHDSESAFNLCLFDHPSFKDGSFRISFRADAGKLDQGGGPVWRVQDENNYYVCRANPLEDNFRLYVVTNGQRRQLATAEAKHSTNFWHTIDVTQAGGKITCTLDSRVTLEATDTTIAAPGAVGLWTKSDARTTFVVPAAWRSAPPAAAPSVTPLDTAAIESITGLKGTLTKDNTGADVFKVTQGRTDVPISVEGRRMEPFMGFTSWAAFQPGAKAEAILAGDLVVFPDEVDAVMDAFFANGCTVTALHNHFFFEEPRTYFLHFGGEGTTAALARGVKSALDAIKSVRAKAPDPRSVISFDAGTVPTTNAITAAKLDAIFFPDAKAKGAVNSGMYKATIGRTAAMACGCTIGSQMGVNTWAGFCGSDDSAAVAGDFVTFPGELQPVLRALRTGGVHIVTIHNHMEGDSPAAIFLHYWGKGRAEDLARTVKSALDTQTAATSK